MGALSAVPNRELRRLIDLGARPGVLLQIAGGKANDCAFHAHPVIGSTADNAANDRFTRAAPPSA